MRLFNPLHAVLIVGVGGSGWASPCWLCRPGGLANGIFCGKSFALKKGVLLWKRVFVSFIIISSHIFFGGFFFGLTF